MKKDEVQQLLERFGFSLSLSKKIGTTGLSHIMHSNGSAGRVVEYKLNEAVGTIESALGFNDGGLVNFSSTSALETWLNG